MNSKISIFLKKHIFFKALFIFLLFWVSCFMFTNIFFSPVFASIPMQLTNCQQWNTCYGNVKTAKIKSQINQSIVEKINHARHMQLDIITNDYIKGPVEHTRLTVNYKNTLKKDELSTYIFRGSNNNKWIIFSHGISCDWTYSFLYALSYLVNSDYNVVLYDSYGVGKNYIDSLGHYGSTGQYSTFGKYEQYGISAIVNWIYKNYHASSPKVGLFGLSMGASTTLLYLENFHDEASNIVKFAISDAAYKNAAEEMGYVGESFANIPPIFFVPGGSIYLSFFAGYFPYSINIISNIKKIKNKKIFLIQGESDTLVPFNQNFFQLMKEFKKNNLLADYRIEKGAFHGDDLSWNRAQLDDLSRDATDGPFYAFLNSAAARGFYYN